MKAIGSGRLAGALLLTFVAVTPSQAQFSDVDEKKAGELLRAAGVVAARIAQASVSASRASRIHEDPLARELVRLAAENGRFMDGELAYIIDSLKRVRRVGEGLREFILWFNPSEGAGLADYGDRPCLLRRDYLLISAGQLAEGPFVLRKTHDNRSELVYAPSAETVQYGHVLAALESLRERKRGG